MYTAAVSYTLILWYCWIDNGESNAVEMPGAKYYDGRKITLPVPDEAVIDLYSHWINQAITGFLSAFASQRIIEEKVESKPQHHHELQNRLMKCALNAKTVKKQAQCVLMVDSFKELPQKLSKSKPEKLKRKKTPAKRKKPKKLLMKKINKYNNRGIIRKQEKQMWHSDLSIKDYQKMNEERRKREAPKNASLVATKGKYKLLDRAPTTLIGILSEVLKKTVQTLKYKNQTTPWYVSVMKLEQLGRQIEEREKEKDAMKKHITRMLQKNSAFTTVQKNSINEEYMPNVKLPAALKSILDSDVYEEKRRKVAGPMKLLRDAIRIGMHLSSRNISNFANKTIRFISPRILSVRPEENNSDEEVSIFSPSIFSLHDKGKGIEKLLSIPNALKAIRTLRDRDQEQLMDFILEASGVNDILAQLLENKTKEAAENVLNVKGIDGQPLYFTKENVTEMFGSSELKNIEVFETLQKTYTQEQLATMNSTGFAQLTHAQLGLIYGAKSPYHDPKTLHKFTSISNDTELRKLLMHDIQLFSEAEKIGFREKSSQTRVKRAVVLSPFLLTPVILSPAATSQPIILSPLVLSPVVLSPAVFGPFILSPWVFIPLILSPRVLAPFIVNPFIFSPIVLSPVALHPFILAPGIFNPLVLNPLVLSPFILSPQAFTPFVLSPMALNPLILTPTLLSPFVLSPFVMSPIIASPQFYFALVLSPYAYSPLIESKLIKSMVVASPSFMS